MCGVEGHFGNIPVLEGWKNEKGWKRDRILLYAIQCHLEAETTSDPDVSWFSLKNLKEKNADDVFSKLSEQTLRNILMELVEEKLLDETDHQERKGQLQKWKLRQDN